VIGVGEPGDRIHHDGVPDSGGRRYPAEPVPPAAEAVQGGPDATGLQPQGEAADAGPPPPEPTGDERVDAALARLGELTAAPVAEHVEVFEEVQRRLQDVLASIDQDAEPPDGSAEPTEAAPGAHRAAGSTGSTGSWEK
jgi:hypothetical protein